MHLLWSVARDSFADIPTGKAAGQMLFRADRLNVKVNDVDHSSAPTQPTSRMSVQQRVVDLIEIYHAILLSIRVFVG